MGKTALSRIPYPSKEAWLADRKNWIGASDLPILLGYGYGSSTPLRLWMEWTGRLSPEPGTVRMEIGSTLEPLVGRLAAEKVREALGDGHRTFLAPSPPERLLAAHVHPRLAVTLDGWVLEGDGTDLVPGTMPLELKTVSSRAAAKWGEDPPAYVSVQAGVQALALEAPAALVFALVGLDEDRRLYRLPAPGRRFRELVVRVVEEFLEAVELDIPPAPVAADSDLLSDLYPKAEPGSIIELGEDFENVLDEWGRLDERIGDLEAKRDALKNAAKAALGEAEAGILRSSRRAVRWKTVQRKEAVVKAYSYRKLSLGTASDEELEALQKG